MAFPRTLLMASMAAGALLLLAPAATSLDVAIESSLADPILAEFPLEVPLEVSLESPVRLPAGTVGLPALALETGAVGVSIAPNGAGEGEAGPGESATPASPTDPASGASPLSIPFVPNEAAPAVAGVGIAAILAALAWGASHVFGFGLFSRIEGDQVLEHQSRARIVQELESNPGLTLQALQARLGLAWGTTWHHVRKLTRTGHIVSVRQGPRRLLYAANTPAARARSALALLHNRTAQRIARTIHDTPDVAAATICQLLCLRAPSVSKHLAKFTQSGLIAKAMPGAGRGYTATPQLSSALAIAA